MIDCVHRGVLLTRGCGCNGSRQVQDDIYRCWLTGESGQCIPTVKVLDVSVLSAAGYRLCETCDQRQEPVRLERSEPVVIASDATPYVKGPVRWEDHRAARERRERKNTGAWIGSTNCDNAEPAVPIARAETARATTQSGGVNPLVVYRVDTTHCQKNFHQFNASIMRWRGDLLMAYRHGWGGATIRLCSLDGNYVAHNDRRVDVAHTPYNVAASEDPRLFEYRGQPFVSFNGVIRYGNGLRTHMMYAALDQDSLEVTATYVLDYARRRTWEKNWTFFEKDGRLLCVYDMAPETVVLEVDGYKATEVSRHPAPVGIENVCGWPRGGAPPVRVGDEWWCFYHGVHDREGRRTYGLGLCAMDDTFRITRVVPACLLWADEADRWASHHPSVVYPAGAVRQGGLWLISMGYQDRWSEIAVFDHKALESALVKS